MKNSGLILDTGVAFCATPRSTVTTNFWQTGTGVANSNGASPTVYVAPASK